MKLVDTILDADAVDTSIFGAFLYGQVAGEYELYTRRSDNKLTIRFEADEDATNFTLKALDEVFKTQFLKSSGDSFINLEKLLKIPQYTKAPVYQPWQSDNTIIGDPLPHYDNYFKINC